MIYLFDFQSLYPHVFMLANLFSPIEKDGWNGSNIFPNIYGNEEDGVRGTYSKEPGKIELLIKRLFNDRRTFDKKDPKNLAYKICLNTLYGLSGSPKFKNLFNITTAGDCTSLSRRCIKYARLRFQLSGYECIYTDSDSIYVKDLFNNEQRILDLAEQISEEERKNFNIYIPTHKLVMDCKIKHMYFFRDDKGNFIKKHYCYVTNEDKIVLKGLQAIKGSASPISKKILDEIIKPSILKGGQVINTYEYWKDVYQSYAKQYPELLIKRFRVWPVETYKVADGKDEATGLHAQISKRYGKGEWFLILNSKIGAGKGNRYAKIEELKEKLGNNWQSVIKVNEYMKDIREFIYWKDRSKLKYKEVELQ